MHFTQILAALASLAAVTQADPSPNYNGYTRKWEATFQGPLGTSPSPVNWIIKQGAQNDNNELQVYTASKANLQFNGAGKLQIIPRRDSTALRGWTSGRIETAFSITPVAGKITRIESSLRVGGNPQKNKQGIWPAFWLLGASFRTGTSWPSCAEIDIMEQVNGQSIGYQVLHCDKYPGGICNEPNGIAKTFSLPDNKFHIYRVEIDRRSSDFKAQSVTWFANGQQVQRVTGAQVNNADVWANIAQKPMNMIFNVAVGGNWVWFPLPSPYVFGNS
jgi:beta-glucanase (GH16 family)